ncbi:MAG TPA: hypothetical protein VNW50_01150 [Streptosporangiaceae bacterium]|nr:hypothetical protein [Streptosporangiaceae bacterium]
MPPTATRTAKFAAAISAALASLALAGPALAAPGAHGSHQTSSRSPRLQVRQLIDGMKLSHTFVPATSTTKATEHLANPDDITVLGHHLFTAFQNGVGPQGEPSTDGNTDSTVVEFTARGKVVHQWDLHGKCDGITADTQRGVLIATVNEDANSSIYTIRPGAPKGRQLTHYSYNRPLPHGGGTDAISIYHGLVLISASAPGTTGNPAPQAAYPAVYSVTFNSAKHVAKVRPLFGDEASATVANVGSSEGKRVQLALTDPDSNELVPASARRFAGDFMETSQGDQQQIFVQPKGRLGSHLTVLTLSRSVDDTAWVRSRAGALYATNTGGDTVDVVTGRFRPGSIIVAATPCDASNAPATCPGPGFPANFLGQLNPWTGHISRVRLTGPVLNPQGLVFIARGWNVIPG